MRKVIRAIHERRQVLQHTHVVYIHAVPRLVHHFRHPVALQPRDYRDQRTEVIDVVAFLTKNVVCQLRSLLMSMATGHLPKRP